MTTMESIFKALSALLITRLLAAAVVLGFSPLLHGAVGAEQTCRYVQGSATKLCIKEVALHHEENRMTARLRVDISLAKQAPHNEYMIWNTCGTKEFRLLSREPMHLPALKRLQTVQATGSEEMHLVLREFGALACATSA